MNDSEHPKNASDDPANVGQPATDATVSVTLGEIQARRDEIGAAIRRHDPSARASVAAVVALFQSDIAQALREGQGWAAIAAAVSTSGVSARADAVRMAYKRLSTRKNTRPGVAPTRLVTTDQPSPAHRTPDPLPGADRSSRRPTFAPRVR